MFSFLLLSTTLQLGTNRDHLRNGTQNFNNLQTYILFRDFSIYIKFFCFFFVFFDLSEGKIFWEVNLEKTFSVFFFFLSSVDHINDTKDFNSRFSPQPFEKTTTYFTEHSVRQYHSFIRICYCLLIRTQRYSEINTRDFELKVY